MKLSQISKCRAWGRSFRAAMLAFIGFAVSATPAIADQHSKEPNLVLITNVNVWDGRSDNVAQGVDVLIEGNLVKKVSR